MNAYANHVVGYLLSQSWQIAILAGIVGLLSFVLRNRNAHIRYLLWLIVLAKCLVPPFLTVPLAVLPERQAGSLVSGSSLPVEDVAPEMPVVVNGEVKPPNPAPAILTTREVAALVWTAGVAVFLLRVGGRAVRYTSWLRVRRRPLPPALAECIRNLFLDFRIRRLPKIWLLEDASQPFVWGLLRGSVYLPADFVGLNESDQQRSVLAHELSHVARFDAGVNLLQVLAQAAYWFHPFVWWANRRVRQEREKCCDEIAIVHLKTPPEHYTGAIVDVLAAERQSTHPIPSLAIVGSVKDIEERIRTMLKPGKTFRKRPSVVAATVISVIALVTIPTALVLTARGQTQPTTQSAATEKPEQARYAARTFNSKMALTVRYRSVAGWSQSWRAGGRTPSSTPLQIPACWLWWVQPEDAVIDWGLLVREIRENMVPGLRVRRATDPDVQRLADLTGLRLLDLEGSQITDAGLAHLKEMSGLEALGLSGTKITDAGLEHLKGLTGLRQLQLNRAAITDAGLKHLQSLTALQRLDLGGTEVTDAGLGLLKDLTRLQLLILGGTRITGEGLEHLKGLPRLQELFAGNTQITDAALEHLKGMTTLQTLRLVDTKITDAGLAYLQGLTGLQNLVLDGTQVTDVGLVHLTGLAALQYLSLSRTQVTDVGIQQLKQSLPKLTIVRGEEPLRTQSADKPAQSGSATTTDNERPEQPRYPARTFNSKLALDVFVREETPWRGWRSGERRIGRTPSATPLEIPPCRMWGVRLEGPVKDWDLLVREINQNRVPELSWSPPADFDLMHLADLTGVQQLDFFGARPTDAGLEHLKGLSGLRGLHVRSRWITDKGLARLKGLAALQELYLDCEVTDASMEHIKDLTGLQRLFLGDCPITDAGLARLKGLTGLQELRLYGDTITDAGLNGTLITDAGFEHFKDLRELRLLCLRGTQFTGAGLVHLKSLAKLRGLILDGPSITDAGLEHLKGLSQLQELTLRLGNSAQVTDAGLEHLRRSTGLQTLDVSGTRVTDAGMIYVKELTRLREFSANGTQITDAGLVYLQGLTGLEGIELADTQVTDAWLELLKGLTGLQALWFSGNKITDAGLEHIKGLTRLRWLGLNGTQITGEGLAHLGGLTELRMLSLNGSPITDAGLQHLRGLTELATLSLNGTQITGTGLAHLDSMTKLYQLQLSDTQLTDAGLEHLKGLTGLRFLSLVGTQVTDVGLAHLRDLTGLERLYLEGTEVTDAGVQQLKQILPKLYTVR